MNTSAEIRWFFRDSPPRGLRDWFCNAAAHGPPAGGGGTRIDVYLADPSQPELGIKRRGTVDDAPGAAAAVGRARGRERVEVKGLVARRFGMLNAGVFRGPVDLWSKWATEALSFDGARLIRTGKRRWLRKFDTSGSAAAELELDEQESSVRGTRPDIGCNVELTEVTLAAATWWTLAFEAFGPLATLEPSVHAAAITLADRQPPALAHATIASYPEWLARHG